MRFAPPSQKVRDMPEREFAIAVPHQAVQDLELVARQTPDQGVRLPKLALEADLVAPLVCAWRHRYAGAGRARGVRHSATRQNGAAGGQTAMNECP